MKTMAIPLKTFDWRMLVLVALLALMLAWLGSVALLSQAALSPSASGPIAWEPLVVERGDPWGGAGPGSSTDGYTWGG